MRSTVGYDYYTRMNNSNTPNPISTQSVPSTVQQDIYARLRDQLIEGGIKPGVPVVVANIAKTFDVSAMPVREAVRRLVSENALELLDNRRIRVPVMTYERFDQLLSARIALETLAAERALPAIDDTKISQLRQIDRLSDEMLESKNYLGVVGNNFEFHRRLYSSVRCVSLMQLIESIWVQLGPFMVTAMQSVKINYTVDRHVEILGAIEANDVIALRIAIGADIRDGIGQMGEIFLHEQANQTGNPIL